MKIKLGSLLSALALPALLAFSPGAARAAALTWDGSANGFWTNAANWTPGLRPTNGDSLFFPAGPAQLLTTNAAISGGGTNFRAITFTGEDYFLYGPTISITNGLTNAAPINGVNTVAARVTARASQTWEVSTKTVLVLASNVAWTNLTLTIANAGLIQFNGALAGGTGATLNKSNVGTMEINGPATMTQLNVRDGTLRLNGTYGGGLAISNGATLSGTGSAGAFTCAGTFSPGGSSPGVFTTTGSSTLSAGSFLSLNLDGLVPGAEHDQFSVPGLTFVTGCSLQIILGFDPMLGDSFVIVTNSGGGAFGSAFSGWPEGATQTVNNVQFRISYVGGNGNDVTLTVAGFTASATTRHWDGGGADAFWLDAANWSNNVAPAGGQNLIFPAGALQLTASNDFPAGTSFNTLTLLAAGYDLGGNALTLLGGIDAAQPSGTAVTVRAPVTFSGAQTVRVENATAVLNLGVAGTAPSLGGQLTLAGAGQVNLDGNLGGAGGLEVRGDVILRGTNSSYAGVTRIYDGARLSLRSSRALGTNSSADDTFVESNGVLEVFLNMTNTEPLRLTGRLTGVGATWLGPVTLLGSNIDLALSGDTIFGPVSGTNVQVFQSQFGPITFATNNNVSGRLVAGGQLFVQGLARFDVLVGPSGELGGTGEVASISANGPVHPGFNGTGALTCSNFANVASGQLIVDLGTGVNSQLRARGSVQLGGGVDLLLNVTGGPALGLPVVILNNTGPSPVSGTFENLPEGATITTGGMSFAISYVGGDGNDVTLTRALLGTGVTRVWDGGGANNFWSNPANWAGDVGPLAGDSILFPARLPAADLRTTNDLPAGTIYDQLIFADGTSGAGTELRGNAIGLLNGVLGTNTADSPLVNVPLQLAGPQTFTLPGAAFTFGAPITLNGDLAFGGSSNISVTVTGAITGAGGVIKTCPGALVLNANNSFDGPVRILNGVLAAGHNSALGLPGGGTFIGTGASLQLAHPGTLTENFLSITGALTALTSNTVSGQIDLPGAGTAFHAGANRQLTLAGTLTGAGSPFLQGGGTFVLTGTNACLGPTTVSSCSLLVQGLSSAGDLNVSSAGLLGGTGVLGRVFGSSGTLHPGASPGSLSSGDVAAGLFFRFLFELNGLAGTEYDQLKVAGTVSLNSPGLELAPGFTPPMGSVFTIIDNDGVDAVSGTFAGLPEGSTYATNGLSFRLSYAGGDGNDVTLTREFVATGTTRTWDGGGANAAWSNRTNWVGDVAPVEGDALFFPLTGARKINSNDFPAFTAFHSIAYDVTGGGCTNSGAALSVAGGIVVTNSSGGVVMSNAVRLLAPQTWQAGFFAATGLDLRGALDLMTNTLTFAGPGSHRLFGPVGGSGGLAKTDAGLALLAGTNTYTGQTLVQAGTLSVTTDGALGGTGGNTVVSAGATLEISGTNGLNLSVAEPIFLDGTSATPATLNNTSRTNTLTGAIRTGAGDDAGQFSVTGGELIVSGVISGGGVLKAGFNRAIFNANNTHTNRTRVARGLLLVNGSQPGSAVSVDNFPGAVLGGQGTVGSLIPDGGLISPGASPGLLTFAGNFNCSAAQTNLFELNGNVAGPGHDQIIVLGDISLNSSVLRPVFGFTPAFGDSFMLVKNNGLNPVTGTFAGLPEGSLITNGPSVLRLSYVGGDGNDVTLTRLAVPTGVTRVWDGGGAGNLWSTPANWAGDIAPQQGDNIVFPAGVAKSPTFDAGTNAAFNTLLFGQSYNLNLAAGHTLRLIAGLTTTNASGLIRIFVPIILENSQTWTVTQPGAVLQPRQLELGFSTLTHAGAGNLDVAGNITGSGGLVGNATGGLFLAGTNTLTGTVLVNSGYVTVLTPEALGSPLAGTFIGTAGRLSLDLPPGQSIDEPLTLAGRVDVVASVTNIWTGPIILAGAQAAFDTATSGRLEVNGPIFGGGFQTLNLGTLVLNGADSFAGPVRVGGFNRLLVNSAHAGVTFVLTNSGQLGGTGVVGQISGPVCAGCEVQPGPADAPGVLHSGDVTLGVSSRLRVQINGPAVGTDYDQLDVTGATTLGGVSLVVTAGFNPGAGISFTVINNDGADPITGTFLNLPQNALLTNNGVLFQISYTGGDGNDVTLTRVLGAPPSTLQPLVLSNGVPVFSGTGVPNAPYVLEASPHIVPPIPWQPISTNTSDGAGLYQFIDLDGTNFPIRFYRVLSP